MTGPEQFTPPVYGCAAGTVLHAHAASALEPGVLLYTFLPPGAAEALHSAEPRVDVHADGPDARTVTVRALAGGTALSWQLPLAPFVAALPGQSGDDGRMVLLAVVDAEPEAGFWAEPVDCERLAAELQLPVAELAEALRGRLTPWLAEDLRLLLDDDAYHRAAERSPAQTLADAVLAHYRGDLEADQSVTRLLRALTLAPTEYSVELGARLCAALVAALETAAAETVQAVTAQSGPFETEVLRLLGELPALLQTTPIAQRTETAMEFLLDGEDREETVRGALSVVTRLARALHGPDLPDEQLLKRLLIVDDAGLVRLAGLWVTLATAASGSPADDAVAAVDVVGRIQAEGPLGAQWLRATASLLAALAEDTAGRAVDRVAVPLQAVRRVLDAEEPTHMAGVEGCLALARFVRSRGRIGPADWLDGPPSAAVSAVMAAYAAGLENETAIDLLSALLQDDVTGLELLDGFICATAQVLARLEPGADEALRQAQVTEMLAALPAGTRGGRWLLAACIKEAPDHDAAAADLSPFVPRDAVVDADRAADKAGRPGMLRAGLSCLDALAAGVGEEAQLTREDLLSIVFPTALIEHELLRQPGRV